MKQVLQLSYYPALEVITGGERRIEAMRSLIKKMGCKLLTYGVYRAYQNGPLGNSYIQLSRTESDWCFKNMAEWELRMTDVVLGNRRYKKKLESFLFSNKPDVVWFEHPYQWLLLREYILNTNTPVVYDCHNIEWKLKESSFSKKSISVEKALNRLFDIETELITSADFTLCCTDSDAKWCQKIGGRGLLMPNGNSYPLKQGTSHNWPKLKSLATDKIVISYISAAHEPNWIGIKDLVLPILKKLESKKSIQFILMGDIEHFFTEWEKANGKLNNVTCLGRISEMTKSDVYKLSDMIVLPITEGGGSNLKTAEALLTSKFVLATDMAFRGFEEYVQEAGVSVVNKGDFSKVFEEIILGGTIKKTYPERLQKVNACLWDSIIEKAMNYTEIKRLLG